jgi:putative DNA primase/helicase
LFCPKPPKISPVTDIRYREIAAAARPHAPTPLDDDDTKRSARAIAIFHDAKQLARSPAERYLRDVRGIPPDPPWPEDLRFHPACPRGAARAPAMVALMRDIETNEPRAIHRTFLKPDGAAKDESDGSAKMMLGPAAGAVIKLTEDADVTYGLALAEGIETALTCRAAGWHVWAAASAGAIAAFPVLSGIDALTVLADHDPNNAGVAAALACAERWRAAGREVQIVRPKTIGQDWNDALNR